MENDIYYTINGSAQGIYKEKGSKFIALGYNVESSEQAMEIVKEIKKEYYNARHHCFAYIIGFDKEDYRMNDDGEPNYTAGKPIYGQLISKDLTNVLVIVIRYFGGIKLGVGGLINAYKQATIDLLNNTEIIKKRIMIKYSLSFDYSKINDVMRVIKENSLEQDNHDFDLNCYLEFSSPKSKADELVKTFEELDGVGIKFIGVY